MHFLTINGKVTKFTTPRLFCCNFRNFMKNSNELKKFLTENLVIFCRATGFEFPSYLFIDIE